MKLLTTAAAALAALLFVVPANAAPTYDTVNAPGGISYSTTPGAQFMGDVFIPTSNQVCEVDGVFVDTVGGGTWNVTVDLWNNRCLGAVGTGPVFSGTYAITLPAGTPPAAYRITFALPAGGATFASTDPAGIVGASFYVAPPGPPCPVGVVPTLVPSARNLAAVVGTGFNGFSMDVQPSQDCVLNPGTGAFCPAGTEWYNFTATPAWTNGNMLIVVDDCTPPPAAFHGPLALPQVRIQRLDDVALIKNNAPLSPLHVKL